MRRIAIVAALAAILLTPATALAADEDERQRTSPLRHDVVVTANRVETPEREVASAVTVITAEDLARTGKTSVIEALRDVLGLSAFQNGGPGAAASVLIRGTNSEHTLVLLDGLALNDPINPSRSFDLAHLPLAQVERIEVLRGPQSPLYGSDAIGGVINIITRTGSGKPRITAAVEGGSFGSVGGDLALQGSGGRADYSIALHHARTAGISAASSSYPGNVEKDGNRNLTLAANTGLALGPGTRLSATLRATRARTEIDSFGGPGGDDPNSVQDYASSLARLQLRDLSPSGLWEKLFSVSYLRAGRDYLNPPDGIHPFDSEEGTYRSSLFKIDWQNNLHIPPDHTLTAGVEFESESGRSEYAAETAWGPSESLFPVARASSAGLYLHDRLDIGGRLFISAGVRADHHSRTGTAVTFRLAPAVLIASTGTKLRATLGTGFKSPSLYQLFAPETIWGPIGNPGLRPERTTGWEVGLEQRLADSRFVVGLAYFHNSLSDLIDFDFGLGYVNVGRARTRGFELCVEARPVEGAFFRFAYTGLRAHNTLTGDDLLRRPRQKLFGELGARLFGRFDLAASVLHTGRRRDRDFSVYPASEVTLPGHTLLGVALAAPAGRGLEVFVRLDNLLNARYEPVWGYGAPGFSLSGGLRLAL